MANDRYDVLLLTMGGTIAGQVAADLHEAHIARDSSSLTDLLPGVIDALNHEFDLDVHVTERGLQDLDSSNILPVHWIQLAECIKAEFDNFDAFVVSHGTNTLGYTCAALSFALANPGKPIVLTGSQVPSRWIGSDALTNLENALRVAVWRRRRTRGPAVRGVLAVFGSHIITGTRVKKNTEFDYDAFTSFQTGSLGRIGRILQFNDANLQRHVDHLSHKGQPAAIRGKDLVCDARFDMRIVSLTEFPGMSTALFEDLHKRGGAHGFILRAFGAGDPCDKHREAFEYLKEQQIPIVVTTQAPNGVANFQVNNPGRYLHEHRLAIPAHDMSIEAQTTKLAWLLAKKNCAPLEDGDRQMSYRALCEEMVTDLRGEINVYWEVDR